MLKFHFECQQCKEQFNIHFKYMTEKENIVCPNCSNTLPKESFSHLKDAVTALENYAKIEYKKENNFRHFNMTFQ